jgi:heat shock protein HslJ
MMIRRFLALAAVAVALSACSSGNAADATADGAGGELQATTWVLDSYDVNGALTIVPPDQYADADFRANRVTGFGGCNDYDAVYVSNGRSIFIGMPKTTLMSCGEATDAFATTYISLLQASRYYNVRGDTLTIRGADLSIILVFDSAPKNPLLGSWIVDSLSMAPGNMSIPLAGTELTAVFRFKTVSGSSGCNTYQGPYTTNGNVVGIGPLAGTQIACPNDVMAQEQAFLKDLQGVGRLDQNANDRITLTDLSGTPLLNLVRPSVVEASPSPSESAAPTPTATASPSASASASASATPSASPTATPTTAPTPTAAPTAAPTATPAASASPAPTVVPPASLPPTATCQLVIPSSVSISVVYPANWFTTTTPANIACQYFDPAAITVPADPTTLKTAVMIKADPATTYQDALTAATNPADWTVLTNEPVTIGGLPATRLEATATISTPEVSAGATRYGYLIDAAGGPLWIETSGTVGDPTFTTNMSVVDLIASQSTLTPTP